jgi:hypothetical protein
LNFFYSSQGLWPYTFIFLFYLQNNRQFGYPYTTNVSSVNLTCKHGLTYSRWEIRGLRSTRRVICHLIKVINFLVERIVPQHIMRGQISISISIVKPSASRKPYHISLKTLYTVCTGWYKITWQFFAIIILF